MHNPLKLSFCFGLVGLAIACTPPPPMAEFDDENTEEEDKPEADDEKGDEDDPLAPRSEDIDDAESDEGDECTDECEEPGKKRCAEGSSAGTEICKQTGGCLRWAQGTDCRSGFSCDKDKNDGSCVAGCSNDSGCNAGSEGDKRCTSNGTAEQTCTKSGSCFVFTTTKSDIAQECESAGDFCSSGRKTCVASENGACTQHRIESNPCPSGTTCQGSGQCVSTCTNDSGCSASNVGSTKCDVEGGRARLTCARSGSCYKWVQSSCSPDTKCSAGSCVDTCANACTLGAGRCVTGSSRSTQKCVTGSNGCTVWAAGQSCPPDSTCQSGSCR